MKVTQFRDDMQERFLDERHLILSARLLTKVYLDWGGFPVELTNKRLVVKKPFFDHNEYCIFEGDAEEINFLASCCAFSKMKGK